MIKKRGFETLVNVRGNANINFDGLVAKAKEMSRRWQDTIAMPHTHASTIRLTPDASVEYTDQFNRNFHADVSDYAFSQMCSKAGVPASYIMKCLESGHEELAIQNFKEWAPEKLDDNFLVRKYHDADGNETVRAVLTDRYNVFDSGLVLSSIQDAIHMPEYEGRYEANQAFLSEDRVHFRFVDFNNPLPVQNDKLYSGFTVSSSDIGSGALCIKYFVYRFACRNGLVIAQGGGTMFRQTHLSDFALQGSMLFANALEQVDVLNGQVMKQIEDARNKKLDKDMLDMFLIQAQRQLHLGKKGYEQLSELVTTVYEPTRWGVINAITEQAQQYTLEDRIAAETFAGKLLGAAA